jgi:hypothetical protein
VLGPDLAPTPFTPDEIRAGCPAGRTIELLVETDGEEPYTRVNRFVACDETGATLERGATGTRVTWAELQAHAAFPAARTTIEPDTIETPLGVLDCLRYTVEDGDDVDVFWFAQAFPGMPVRYRTRDSTTTMITSTLSTMD